MSGRIAIATEDELSEAVAVRIVQVAAPGLIVASTFRRDGFGYLRKSMERFCGMAPHLPVLLLTDLDKSDCAPSLIRTWLGPRSKPREFLFRVAVRETEAWLLADHDAMAKLFGRRDPKLPEDPDALSDPKAALIRLARKAPRSMRTEIAPEPGAAASQGLGYNAVLCRFVREHWDPVRAAVRSNSLRRALDCVARFAARASRSGE